MTEATLTSTFLSEVRNRLPGAVALKHNDRITCGIPDVSVTLGGRTSWFEMKHACPTFQSTGIQELTMLRLAAAGNASYIVWEDKAGIKRTLIVHPKNFKEMIPERWCVGFDMKWLVEQVKKEHMT